MLSKKIKLVLIILALSAPGIFTVFMMTSGPKPPQEETSENTLQIVHSSQGGKGKTLFEKTCADCHGKGALGTDKGPAFIEQLYAPEKLDDMSFLYAIQRGAKAQHWPYGDMDAIPELSDREIAYIVRYIREVQKANGIF
jgi:cytochrome c